MGEYYFLLMNKKTRRSITPADLRAADNLRKIWQRRKREWPHLTQEWTAEQFGGTQGLISHYLVGRAALGPVAVLKFSRILKVSPKQIRDDLNLTTVSDDLTPEALEFVYKWLSLPPKFRKDIVQTVDNLLTAGSDRYDKFLEKMGGIHHLM